MKAIANTNIRLGLVNLPVAVVQAVEGANDVKFNQAGPNGEKLVQQYAIASTGTVVSKTAMQKGIFQGEDFFPISSEDLEAIDEATKLPDLNIEEVVSASEFWSRAPRITGLYYVQNQAKAGNINAMKLFVDTMESDNLVMVTKWTARSRQKQMVLWARGGILHASSLAFAGDVRSPDDTVRAHLAGTYSDQEQDMARQLLTALTKDKSTVLDMDVDEAVPMKHKLVDDALAGRGVEVPAQPAQPKANAALADALAASLAAIKTAA